MVLYITLSAVIPEIDSSFRSGLTVSDPHRSSTLCLRRKDYLQKIANEPALQKLRMDIALHLRTHVLRPFHYLVRFNYEIDNDEEEEDNSTPPATLYLTQGSKSPGKLIEG